MCAQGSQVAIPVLFKVISIDDDGRLRFALPTFNLFRIGGRIKIVDYEDKSFAVRRPGKFGNTTFDIGNLVRFATGAIQQPDLCSFFLFLFIAARSQKGEIAVVRAPTGHTFTTVGRGGKLDPLAAIPAD